MRRDEDRQQPRPPGLQTLVSEATLSSHVNSVPQPHSSWVDTNTTPFQLILQTLTLLGEAVVHPEHGAVPHGAADQLVAPSTKCDYELLFHPCPPVVLAEQLEGVQGLAVGVELPGGGVDLRTRVGVTCHV